MNTQIRIAAVIALIGASTVFPSWQLTGHLITLPLIEGGGIYTAVRTLDEGRTANSKAASITTLSLLGANAAAGVTTMFGPKENYPTMRTIHRTIGFALTAAAIWLSVAGSLDDNVRDLTRGVGYGYTAFTMVPLLIFNF